MMHLNSDGKHVILDAYDCNREVLNNQSLLESILTQVAKNLEMKVLSSYFHPFQPQGVTGMIALASSHISIHTWPEEGYASLDIYTCGEHDPMEQAEFLLHGIAAKSARIYSLSRGNTNPGQFQEYHWPYPREEAEIEKKFDAIGLNEILSGEHREVFNGKSNLQHIQLIEASDLRMYLNGQLQFSSLDERIYHEALVHPALTLASSKKHILILGGGDGLALREVLRYSDVWRITLVDVDPLVVDAAKYVPNLVKLNEHSLHNSRVTVLQQDAAAFLASNHFPYDVIMVDLPDPTTKILSDLYTIEFYSLLGHSLADDGIFVCQAHSLELTPIVYWSIGKTIESAGFQTLSYHTLVPSFGDWGFHIGSKNPIRWGNKQVQIPARTLPAKLEDLSDFSPHLAEKKKLAIVNSRKNSILHMI
jgi:spermidine synthase